MKLWYGGIFWYCLFTDRVSDDLLFACLVGWCEKREIYCSLFPAVFHSLRFVYRRSKKIENFLIVVLLKVSVKKKRKCAISNFPTKNAKFCWFSFCYCWFYFYFRNLTRWCDFLFFFPGSVSICCVRSILLSIQFVGKSVFTLSIFRWRLTVYDVCYLLYIFFCLGLFVMCLFDSFSRLFLVPV